MICAIHHAPVGIDVEFIRPLDLRITRFACTEKDWDFVNEKADQKEKEMRFFRLWTAKEAYIKFHGKVLADLKSVEYQDIKDRCEILEYGGYIVTVYTEE